MTASLVQSKAVYDTTSGTTIAATFDSSVTSGNTIIAAITWEDDGTVTIADDVNSGNYTKHVEEVDRVNSRTVIASIPNTASSAITVTATFSDPSEGHIVIMEVSGIDDSAIDATAADNGATGDPTLSLTTVANNCFVVAARAHWPANTGADTGFTSLANATGGSTSLYHSVEYNEDIGSAGLNTLTFNGATGEYFSAAAASFAPAAAAAQTYGVVPRKVPWTSKPPPGTPLNKEHPLARGLFFFCAMDEPGDQHNLVDNKVGTFEVNNAGANDLVSTPWGRAHRQEINTTGDLNEYGFDWGDEYDAPGPRFTYMARVRPDDEVHTSGGYVIGKQDTAGSSLDYGVFWASSNSFTFRVNSGDEANISRASGDYYTHLIDVAFRNNPDDGTNGAASYIWNDITANDARVRSASAGYASINTGTGGFALGHRSTDNRGFDGEIHWAAMWSRTLSEQELDSFHKNPWQIFEPQTQHLPVSFDTPAAQTYGVVPRKVPWTKQPTTRTQLDYSHPFKPIQAIVPGWDHIKDADGQVNSVGKQRLIYSAAENGTADVDTHLDVKAESHKRWGSFNCWHQDFDSGDIGDGYILERSEPGDTGIQFADTDNFCVVGIYKPFGDGTVGNSDPRIYSKDEGNLEANHDLMIGTDDGTGGQRARCRIRIGSSTVTRAVSLGSIVDNDSWNIILGGVEPHPTAGDVNVTIKCIKESNGTVTSAYKASTQATGTYNPRTTTSEAVFGNAEITGNELDGRILGVFFFDKMLSDEELAAFFQNPWQIFEPQTQYLPTAFDTPTETFGFIKREIPWTRQPPPGTPIDWSNPICQAAALIVTGSPGPSQEVYTNGALAVKSLPSAVENVPAKWGNFANYESTDDSWIASDYAFTNSATAPYTALWVADWQGDNYDGAWSVALTASSHPTANFYATDGYSPISAGNRDQSTATWHPTNGIATADFQQLHAAVFRFTGDWTDTGTDGFKWWCNGKESTTVARIASSLGGSTANETRIGRPQTTASAFDGLIGPFVFVPSGLPDALCKSFSENPWQIFEPRTQYIPVSFGAAAPPPGDDIIIQIPVWWR